MILFVFFLQEKRLYHDFLKRFYLFIFREREMEGGRERKKQQHADWSVASLTPPTGDLAYNPGTWPDLVSNQQPLGLQAKAQSTEPHHPGLNIVNPLPCGQTLLNWCMPQKRVTANMKEARFISELFWMLNCTFHLVEKFWLNIKIVLVISKSF